MIPKIFINLRYTYDGLKILGVTEKQSEKGTSFYLPDIVESDDQIIAWLKDMNLSQEEINKVIESLTELGVEVGKLLNTRN